MKHIVPNFASAVSEKLVLNQGVMLNYLFWLEDCHFRLNKGLNFPENLHFTYYNKAYPVL